MHPSARATLTVRGATFSAVVMATRHIRHSPGTIPLGQAERGGGVVARGFQHGSRSENGAWSPVSLLPLIPFSVIKWRNSIQWLLRDLISAPTSGSTQCLGVMSDSEDESQDKQLKVVVIGDGACGKVRTSTVGPIVGRGRWGKRACWKKKTALAARLVLPC